MSHGPPSRARPGPARPARRRAIVSVSIGAWIALLAPSGGTAHALPEGEDRAAAAKRDTDRDPRDAASEAAGQLVLAGTYTGDREQGVFALRLDRSTGALEALGGRTAGANPSFLALHPSRRILYAVNETRSFQGESSGAVSAFAIEGPEGRLRLLSRVASGGASSCHLVVHPSGRWVLVANYGGGSVAALPIEEDGSLGERTSLLQHEGSGADPRRQAGPHAHAVEVAPGGRFVVAADLGADRVFVHQFDPGSGKLTPADPPAAPARPGAGPRHLAFGPEGRRLWAICELDSTVAAFAWDATRGTLEPRGVVSTLPEGYEGSNSTAELALHPSGRFLYGSNRGHDSIAAFDVPGGRALPRPIEHEPTGGRTPRSFGIAPGGRWLLAANQGSDSVVVLRIDPATGALEPAGHEARVPSPVCVVFPEVRSAGGTEDDGEGRDATGDAR